MAEEISRKKLICALLAISFGTILEWVSLQQQDGRTLLLWRTCSRCISGTGCAPRSIAYHQLDVLTYCCRCYNDVMLDHALNGPAV
jgi:hypothetical protein